MLEPFEMNRVQRGARLRRSPYFEATQRYRAWGYTVYNHMLFPIGFDDLEAEYWKLLAEVTLWDVSVEKVVEITGPDGFAFANLLTPRDLTRCQVGQCRYVIIADQHGGIINDPVLLRLGPDHFWLALADSDVSLWARGLAYALGLNVHIQEPEVYPLQVQGPKSRQVLQDLFGPPIEALRYYHLLETELDGIPLVITRTGWTGEVGYEIFLRDSQRGDELWERIMAAGRPYGISPTGPSDIRRIEAGILNYGIDMTLSENPFEVGLDWLVDLDQEADFIGKAALQRIQANGVTRKLVGIEIQGERIEFNMSRWPVLVESQPVGAVTSAIYSPRLDKNIGYALLPIQYAGLGTRLQVSVPASGLREAEVVAMPFIDPNKQIPKA